MPFRPRPLEERFDGKVDHSGGPQACWPWQGSRLIAGYGKIQNQGHQMMTHRLAFFFKYGYLPPVVLHTCDNPPCCNWAHLVAGDQAANIADMDYKGRRGRGYQKPRFFGEGNMQAKLTESTVREIRSSSETLIALARRFGVSFSAVQQAKSRTTWRHVK